MLISKGLAVGASQANSMFGEAVMAGWSLKILKLRKADAPNPEIRSAATACEQWLANSLMKRAMLLGFNEAKGFLAAHARIALAEAVRAKAKSREVSAAQQDLVVRTAAEIAVATVMRRMKAEGWREAASQAA